MTNGRSTTEKGPLRRTGEARPTLPTGVAVAIARVAFGVGQTDLAEAAGMTRGNLAQLESGYRHAGEGEAERLMTLIPTLVKKRRRMMRSARVLGG